MTRENIIKIVVIISFLVILLFLVFLNSQGKTKQLNHPKVINKIEIYDYKLIENQPLLYKDLFEELVTILSTEKVDYEQYAIVISKMFVVDFYDLDSKISKNNVGGLQFIHEDIKTNFITNAQNTIYNHLQNNIYGNRQQELPNVKDIEIVDIVNKAYTYNGITDENAFYIKLKWSYTKDLGYQSEALIIIVKEENKLKIVELQS